MKISSLVLIIVSTGLFVHDTACAVKQNGAYYAIMGSKLPADQRFVVLADWDSKVVLDKETGLVRARIVNSRSRTWIQARTFCMDQTLGWGKGWRLPSIVELFNLVDPYMPFPAQGLVYFGSYSFMRPAEEET